MPKRKRVVLNFSQKLEILQQLNGGASGTVLAKQYGVGTSTISDIKRNGDAILRFVSNMECHDRLWEKKTRKTAQNTDLDSTVYKWYSKEKNDGAVPPDATICAKALELNQQLANTSVNFKASPGWLRHFKYRHGIKQAREHSEDDQTPCAVSKQLKNFIKRGGYLLENVYNADETIIKWRSFPNFQGSNDTVAAVICTNANASHRLPIWVVAQEKNIKTPTDSSIVYKYQQNSEINPVLFEQWFGDLFTPEVKKRQESTGNTGKTLLIIDDSSWHPHYDALVKNHEDIDVFYLPNHVVAATEPMELGVKQEFKTIYRKNLLDSVLAKSPCPLKQFVEEYTLTECLPVISEAWKCVNKATIVQAWGRLLLEKSETSGNPENLTEMVRTARQIIGLEQCDSEDISQWLENDKEDYYISSVEEDIDFASNASCEDIKDVDLGREPSHMEAYQSLNTVIQWFTKQEEFDCVQLSILQTLRDLAASKLCGTVKAEEQ